ncbi:MAG: molecular chaperone [Caulobacterales bacterium]|nr:molecular chaperone [Caulobacterales bacterium]
MRSSVRALASGLAAVAALALAGIVWAMTVQPVAVELTTTGRGMSAPIRVENDGPSPLPVEVRIVETDFDLSSVRASDRLSDNILVFPPQAIIPPGETQVFRLQYVGEPDPDTSRHFYAEVSQQPVELPEGQSAIQILYNFQVMVNVASATAGQPQLSVSGTEIATNGEGQPVAAFTVRNDGRNYGYLSRTEITIRHNDPAGREVLRRTLSSNDIQQLIGFGLVGPLMSRRFVVPIQLESSEGTVEVTLSQRGR